VDRAGFAGEQHPIVAINREVVIADLGPVEREICLRGKLEADASILAARRRDTWGTRLAITCATDNLFDTREDERQFPSAQSRSGERPAISCMVRLSLNCPSDVSPI
jgi:hypothetical protein